MADLVEDFLNEAASRLSDLEGLLIVLKNDPAEQTGWEGLRSFFSFVRSVTPFIGFMRSYRLSDAAVREVDAYQNRKRGLDVLPSVLLKLQRIRKILSVAEKLKREDRQSDNDILPSDDTETDVPLFFGGATVRLPDVTAQETALDKREEELVLWAQALAEQEDELKRKENIVFSEEQKNPALLEVFNRLDEQEKLRFDLENHLEQTQSALEDCQEKLELREEERERTNRLLETKENALTDMGRTIQELKRQLEEKEYLSQQRENLIALELEKNREQAETLQNDLNRLREHNSESQKGQEMFFAQYAELEKEYKNNLALLNKEKEDKASVVKEKQELERQHLEFNSRMTALQKQLNLEKDKLKQAELELEQQKNGGEILQSELQAAGWPFDTEKLQRKLAVLARQKQANEAIDSLIAMKELIGKIRRRSLVRISRFFKGIARTTARKYRRAYDVIADCNVVGGVDKDTLAVLKQMLVELTENAFNHAFPKDKGNLLLNLKVREKGAFLYCSVSDNGAIFDFDRLSYIVRVSGMTDKQKKLSPSELMPYLFHNAVKIKNGSRGLTETVKLIEKSGGQVAVTFNDGLHIDFSIPKYFLFDKVLIFQMAGQLLAIPLNAVAETVFLKREDIRINNETQASFFYWKGEALPILNLDTVDQAEFGLIVQAGVFRFFIPVQQVLETEHFISFSENEGSQAGSYLTPCVVLESGREILWLDLAELLRQIVLPLPEKVISLDELNTAPERKTVYLIFKSEPEVFKAVRADAVLRVEDFNFSARDLVHKRLLETRDGVLSLRDSCPREGYPHAQAVLIFKNFALAVHEVADIIELSSSNISQDETDSIVYHNKKVPVFTPDA